MEGENYFETLCSDFLGAADMDWQEVLNRMGIEQIADRDTVLAPCFWQYSCILCLIMLDDKCTKPGEIMAQQKVYTAKHTLYLSKAMLVQLDQLAAKRNGEDATINSVIREALRQYLDNQEDVIGSRRHFQRTLQSHIDALQQRLEFSAQLNTRLSAFCFAYLINGLMQKPVTATQLIERAAKDTKRYEAEYAELISNLRSNSSEDAKE